MVSRFTDPMGMFSPDQNAPLCLKNTISVNGKFCDILCSDLVFIGLFHDSMTAEIRGPQTDHGSDICHLNRDTLSGGRGRM